MLIDARPRADLRGPGRPPAPGPRPSASQVTAYAFLTMSGGYFLEYGMADALTQSMKNQLGDAMWRAVQRRVAFLLMVLGEASTTRF